MQAFLSTIYHEVSCLRAQREDGMLVDMLKFLKGCPLLLKVGVILGNL